MVRRVFEAVRQVTFTVLPCFLQASLHIPFYLALCCNIEALIL